MCIKKSSQILILLCFLSFHRRKKQKLLQTNNEELNVPLQPLNNNQNNSTVAENTRQHQQRNLIKNTRVLLSTDEGDTPDDSCTSGFYYESTPLHQPSKTDPV